MESKQPVLTGRPAAEALALILNAGNRDARFDAKSFMRALRTRKGRQRILFGMLLPLRRLPTPRRRTRAAGATSARRARIALSGSPPGRPRPSGSR